MKCTCSAVTKSLAGFGGLGQRPNPDTERGIVTNSGSVTGGLVGGVLPGTVTTGVVTTRSASLPGRHPAGTANRSQDGAIRRWLRKPKLQNKSDYGTDSCQAESGKGSDQLIYKRFVKVWILRRGASEGSTPFVF